jgi:hypothetical protein
MRSSIWPPWQVQPRSLTDRRRESAQCGARPSRRLGAAAPLGATRPSASSFIGRNTAAPKATDQCETKNQARISHDHWDDRVPPDTTADAKASNSCGGPPTRPQASARPGPLLRVAGGALGLLGLGTGRPGPPAGQGLAGGDLGGHLRQLASRRPGRPPQMGESLLVVQAFAFHQGALGSLDQAPRVQRGLELVGQRALELSLGSGPEEAGHHPGVGLQGGDLGVVPAPRVSGIDVQGADGAATELDGDTELAGWRPGPAVDRGRSGCRRSWPASRGRSAWACLLVPSPWPAWSPQRTAVASGLTSRLAG